MLEWVGNGSHRASGCIGSHAVTSTEGSGALAGLKKLTARHAAWSKTLRSLSMKNRFFPGVVLAAVLTLPVLACSSVTDAQNGLCCADFKPGQDMAAAKFTGDASLKGQFTAFGQAAGDMSALAGTALADVTGACMAIATDLGDDPATPMANGKTGADLLTFWCGEAKAKINATLTASFGASGSASLKLDITPPVCSASLTATASCQGSCDVNAKCDIKANPPKCTGGTLEVECSGSCNASATAPTIECTGSCSGTCEGTCEASGGVAVDCDGKCEGTCAAGGSAGGSGIQADGSCKGTCSAKCTASATAPKIACKGTCGGKCTGNCTATPGMASVKCSGTCMGDFKPLSCTGGKLEGGCMVSANCQANCNASASAKASCTPPEVKIGFTGSVTAGAEGQLNVLINTLEANLPKLVLVVKARGADFAGQLSGVISGGADITASGKLDAAGTACLVKMGAAAGQASTDFAATLKASIDVTASIGMK